MVPATDARGSVNVRDTTFVLTESAAAARGPVTAITASTRESLSAVADPEVSPDAAVYDKT